MITALSTILFVFGTSFFVLFLFALTRQRNSLSAPFSIMCLAISVYIFGYALELRADSLEEILFFIKMEYFGAPFMSAFFLIFAYRFHFRSSMPFRVGVLALIIPVLTLFFSVTNEFHHLLYRQVSATPYHGSLLINFTPGLWYPVNVIYAYCAILFGGIIFFLKWKQDGYRVGSQPFFLFFGSLWPGVVSIIYMLGHSPLRLDLTPFGLSFSAIFYYMAIFRFDFLELRQTVKDVVLREIQEGILVIDDKDRLIDFNRSSAELFPWLNIALIGQPLAKLPQARPILEETKNPFELELIRSQGTMLFEVRKTDLKENDRIIGSVYTIRDITEEKKVLQQLNQMANQDYLTGIHNRRSLLELAQGEMDRAARYQHPTAVLMIDIDEFKKVNDTYGHLAGDQVLRNLVKVCQGRIRRTDSIGRYGGEEFLVIMPETDLEGALTLAETIRQAASEETLSFDSSIIKYTVSIGVSCATSVSSGSRIEPLIHLADQALYHAKRNGRNRVSTPPGHQDYDPNSSAWILSR